MKDDLKEITKALNEILMDQFPDGRYFITYQIYGDDDFSVTISMQLPNGLEKIVTKRLHRYSGRYPWGSGENT